METLPKAQQVSGGKRMANRTLDQNAAQWPILEAWSQQKMWIVNGAKTRMNAEEWKDVLTAAFEGETAPRLAMGLNGGVVMLGRRTSKYNKARFSEWLDWLMAASHHANIDLTGEWEQNIEDLGKYAHKNAQFA